MGQYTSIYLFALASSLNGLAALEGQMGHESESDNLCQQAVEIAESPIGLASNRHLAKGRIEHSYASLVTRHTLRGEADHVFGYLASIRDPETCMDTGLLNTSITALREAEDRASAAICILMLEPLPDNILVATLTSSDPFFRCELAPEFYAKGLALVRANDGWRQALQLWTKAAVKNASSASLAMNKVEAAASHIHDAAYEAWTALPSWVQSELRRNDGTEILVSAGRWTAFPFEMLRFGPLEDQYLGLQWPLPRIGGISADCLNDLRRLAVGDGHRQAVIVADPNHDLESAAQEGKSVDSILRARGYPVTALGARSNIPATDRHVLAHLTKPHMLFHYAGHGAILTQQDTRLDGVWDGARGEEVLLLKDNMPLGPSTLRQRKLEGGPLVVLNCCMAGRVRLFGGMREDLAGVFLRNGATAVVASAFPIGTLLAATFGHVLYVNVGVPLQKAVLHSRLATEKEARDRFWPMWPGWAFFILHGNPYAYIPG